MDKLMDNHWFLRGIALLLALLLYMVINLDKQPQDGAALPIGEAAETIQNVEVMAYYDQDKYVVSGLPENIDITLQGSTTAILQTKMKEEFEVFANLHGYEPGTYEIRLQYNGIPDSLKVKLQPAKVQITVEPKKTKAFPIEVGYLNSNQIKEGYNAEKAIVKPSSIEIAGTEAQLEQVGAVMAYVDLKGVNEDFTKEAKVVVHDKSGKTLNLQTDPSLVTITVPVSSPEKIFPIKVTQKGNLQPGLIVTSIKVEPNEVKVYGAKDVLDSIEALEDIVLDLDKITETTVLEVAVTVPKGAAKIAPAKVKVTVQIQKLEQRTLSDIPLKLIGLEDAYRLSFLEPNTGKISVDAIGEAKIINELDISQLQASVNVQGLGPGIHDTAIQISGPNNIKLELKQKIAKIEIINKG